MVGVPIFVQAFTLDDFAANSLGLGATTGLRLVPALAEQLLVARSLSGSRGAMIGRQQATEEPHGSRV